MTNPNPNGPAQPAGQPAGQPGEDPNSEPGGTAGAAATGEQNGQQQQQQQSGEPATKKAAGDPPQNEELGENGVKALKSERDARKALEKQVERLKPLEKILEAVGSSGEDPKNDVDQLTERLSKHEEDLNTERQARWRAEIAHEKSLTAKQAERLVGTTRDELTADADALLEAFPAPQQPSTPKPDRSQGGTNGTGVDIDALISEAQGKGDFKRVIQLQNQKLQNQ